MSVGGTLAKVSVVEECTLQQDMSVVKGLGEFFICEHVSVTS